MILKLISDAISSTVMMFNPRATRWLNSSHEPSMNIIKKPENWKSCPSYSRCRPIGRSDRAHSLKYSHRSPSPQVWRRVLSIWYELAFLLDWRKKKKNDAIQKLRQKHVVNRCPPCEEGLADHVLLTFGYSVTGYSSLRQVLVPSLQYFSVLE